MSRKMNQIADFPTITPSSQPTTILLQKVKGNPTVFIANNSGEINVFNPSQPQTPQIRLFDPSASQVTALEYHSAFSSILSGNARGLVSLIDLESGKLSATFAKHSTTIKVIRLFPSQSNCFVSGSLDTTIRIWDIRQKQEITVFKGHSKQVNDLSVSPDDSMIASASDDGLVKLWNISTSKSMADFQTERGNPVNCVSIHPLDFQIAFGGNERVVSLYNITSCKFQGNSKEMPSALTCLTYDSLGKYLFAAGPGYLRVLPLHDPTSHEIIETSWKKTPQLLISDHDVYGLAVHSNCVRLTKLGLNLEKLETEKHKKNVSSVMNIELPGLATLDDEYEQKELESLQAGHVQIMKSMRNKLDGLVPIVVSFFEQGNIKASLVAIEKLDDDKTITDLLNVFLNNGALRKVNIEFATLLIKKASLIFDNKYKFCLKTSLRFTLETLKQFSQDIISIKAFSQLAKVDLERDERIKRYDTFLAEIDNMVKKRFFMKLLTQFQTEEIGTLAQAVINDYQFIVSGKK